MQISPVALFDQHYKAGFAAPPLGPCGDVTKPTNMTSLGTEHSGRIPKYDLYYYLVKLSAADYGGFFDPTSQVLTCGIV